ncbi:MAG: MFS transporter [Anaerolineae bacterium]|nr:MFS transporter [Anaerolineae bacterium]
MQLDWRKTFLIGLGFLGISVMWGLYNLFVPIFLQAGDPAFDAQNAAQVYAVQDGDTPESIAALYGLSLDELRVLNEWEGDVTLAAGDEIAVAAYKGFGLNATLTGTIMTLDNIAALFILPLIGVWSDRTRTRFGRRYPYILTAAPVAAVAFVLIPLAAGMINPAANGSVGENSGPFALFLLGAGGMLTAMAVLRTPVIALMPDLIPSPLRSKANGVINFMGGVGGIIAALGLAALFDIQPVLPFLIASLILVIAVLLLFWRVKEPAVADLLHEESDEEAARGALRGWQIVPQTHRRSLLLLLAAIFCWFVGYNALETFYSSYAVTTLDVTAGTAGMLFSIALLTFVIFAIPAGYIGTRFGRRRTILIGLALFAVLLALAFFIPSVPVVATILGVGGMAWALVNINSLPMVVDTTDDERLLGTYTGFYYFASQAAAILGPILNGVIIDLAGRNYSVIFLVTPAFFVLAIVCMIFVTRGEAHTASQAASAS